MNKRLVITVGLALPLSFGCVKALMADQSGWSYQPGSEDSTATPAAQDNENYAFRFPIFEDDITPDQNAAAVVLTSDEKHQAAVWGLSPGEEMRYVLLMQNRSGMYYNQDGVLATPIDVLGLNARTDTERNKYAELSAYQDSVKHAKELAYQSSYDAAMKQLGVQYHLTPIRPFDVSPFSPYKNAPVQLQSGDRLMFYVHPGDNTVEITTDLLKMMDSDTGVQLNVYFMGNATQGDAVSWAKANNIPEVMVQSGAITLNLSFNNSQNVETTPAMYLVRNGQSQAVNLSKF